MNEYKKELSNQEIRGWWKLQVTVSSVESCEPQKFGFVDYLRFFPAIFYFSNTDKKRLIF